MPKQIIQNNYNTPIHGDTDPYNAVKVLEGDDPLLLEAHVTNFIGFLTTTPDINAFIIKDIHYSSAQVSNNQVSYSALVHYITIG